MFTGLVEDVGEVVAVRPEGDGRAMALRTGLPLSEVAVGDSIAVNGVCLTAESLQGDRFTAVAGRETLDRTTLGGLRVGDRVHLERALRVGDRLGGHIVQGHVDGVGRLVRAGREAESVVLWVELPDGLQRYVVPKGSICLDGVSLTVNEIEGPRIRVNIVPHTVRATRLGHLSPGEAVNVEVDILAKYVERLLGSPNGAGGLTLETLTRHGFAE